MLDESLCITNYYIFKNHQFINYIIYIYLVNFLKLWDSDDFHERLT